jgi:hypothetical protein
MDVFGNAITFYIICKEVHGERLPLPLYPKNQTTHDLTEGTELRKPLSS